MQVPQRFRGGGSAVRRLVSVAALAVYLTGFAVALGPAGVVIAAAAVAVGALAVAAGLVAEHPFQLPRPTRLPALPSFKRPRAAQTRLAPHARIALPRVPRVDVRAQLHAYRPRVARATDRVVAATRDAGERLSARAVELQARAAERRSLPATPLRDALLDEAVDLNRIGAAARREGRLDEAADAHRRALELYRDAGSRRRQALTLSNLGLVEAETDPDTAVASFEAALALLREVGDRRSEGQVLANLGSVHQRAGREDAARRCWEEAVGLLDPRSPEQARLAARLATAG